MRTGLSDALIKRILSLPTIGGGEFLGGMTLDDLEKKYPPRNLPDGAYVTRFAPSPTGFFHTGNLYPSLVDKKLAQQSGGVFILRIEDTDTKREVAGAIDIVVNGLKSFGLDPDEGMIGEDTEIGAYGPYKQTMRKSVYHSVVSELLRRGDAYPCFLSAEDMDEIRARQTASGMATGIYGQFARDRELSEDEIITNLDAGLIPSIRLYSNGLPGQKIFCKDVVRGSIAFPENIDDIVLIKSNDGIPTYHFAALCDDHFMRVTQVVRGEEWLPSLPLHIQLFNMMNWTPPSYMHTSTIDKIDEETNTRRKLSKRKDHEASVALLFAEGWAPEPIIEYIFNIIASGYEDAKMKNPKMTVWDYPINVKKLSASGALFDMRKLEWWAREFIATMDESKYEITDRITKWAEKYDTGWYTRIKDNKEYLHNILSIERDDPKRIRKDFVTWKQTLNDIEYFYDDLFHWADSAQQSIFDEFLKTFYIDDSKDVWWDKIKTIATQLGTKNGDVAMALRVALTGRTNTPDLYSIMQVMGDTRVRKRLK